MSRVVTSSEKQTIALGKKLASQLKGGEVLGLIGNLGAGKTTLIKGIAQGLGIKKPITSPTFVLMKVYRLPSTVNGKRSTVNQLVHIDCYRIKKAQEISAIGAEEYFNQKDTVVVIEWAEKIKSILSRQTLKIKLRLKDKNIREITLK